MDQTRALYLFDPERDSSESGVLDVITISITLFPLKFNVHICIFFPYIYQTSFGSSEDTKEVEVILEEGAPLDIELEGGSGSLLGGKIVISEVYPGGSVDKSG